MKEYDERLTRRCTDADVDPDWWIEHDRLGPVTAQEREDNLRASLLCHECPFLRSCREGSWDEPAHVWGGLDTISRFRARRTGEVRDLGLNPRLKPISSETLQEFLGGGTTREVAATMNRSESVTRTQLRNELQRRRLGSEEQWGQVSPPPALPWAMTLDVFRVGAALPSEYRAGAVLFDCWSMGEAS